MTSLPQFEILKIQIFEVFDLTNIQKLLSKPVYALKSLFIFYKMPKIHNFCFQKMSCGSTRYSWNRHFHRICLFCCTFHEQLWIRAKNDKNRGIVTVEMSIFGQSALLSTFWARIQYSETTKIMISGKKYFAHDFFICIPLIYVKERKFHDHHYQKVARSSDSYRQCLLTDTGR